MTAGVPFKYQSGEEVKCGDRVLFHGEAGRIEFVADAAVQDNDSAWYVQEYGGGVMIIEPRSTRTFLTNTEDAEDLFFVARSQDSGCNSE